jgi:branched-chain amino acid transport system ATP-binding protein
VSAVLKVEGLCKHFGALAVTQSVDLDVPERGLHAVIGPNGAGKTTLVNQLMGTLRPDAGRIMLARLPRPLRVWGRADADRRANEAADAALADVGLSARADVRARDLSHGERRGLEIACALALAPLALLLDEPLAGTGHEEAARLIELLARLKTRLGLLLVEHDMDAVFRLADSVSVLVAGQVIASGAPGLVRADPAVRAAYLGDA